MYDYVETDDDNDDGIDGYPDLNFKARGSFTSHTTSTWSNRLHHHCLCTMACETIISLAI